MLGYKGIMISRRRIRSGGSDQKMSKLNSLRGAPDQTLIGKELHEVLWIWWTLLDIIPTKDLAVHNGADVSIGNQSDEEGDAKASAYRNVWIIRCFSTKELWFQDEGPEVEALIKRWVSWIDLEVHPIKSWLGKNQLISRRMFDPERKFPRINRWLRVFANTLNP